MGSTLIIKLIGKSAFRVYASIFLKKRLKKTSWLGLKGVNLVLKSLLVNFSVLHKFTTEGQTMLSAVCVLEDMKDIS